MDSKRNKPGYDTVQKVKAAKVYTRAQAERALTADRVKPEDFTGHANYHVRRKAWTLMGRPLPEGTDDQNKFLTTLQGMAAPKDAGALPGFHALIRQRILKEVPTALENNADVTAGS